MKNDEGAANIQVEEYKRPKFYIDYEKIKGSYTVNDTIKITGMAKAYAGNSIDKAHVKYRVVRQPRFLYPWLFRKWRQPPVPEMEIAHDRHTCRNRENTPVLRWCCGKQTPGILRW
jgi:hypothetical protein